MLSKDLTPHPKAVNIIRPPSQPQQTSLQPSNFSSSTNSSSGTFSTASTTTINTHYTNTNTAPMIRQPSSENPGLSFFCHQSQPKPKVIQKPFENMHPKQAQQPPLVISRINLSNFNRRPITQTDGMTTLDEDVDDVEAEITESPPSNRLNTTFTPGFGMMNGVGSFLLRGNLPQPKPQVDEARVYRKVSVYMYWLVMKRILIYMHMNIDRRFGD